MIKEKLEYLLSTYIKTANIFLSEKKENFQEKNHGTILRNVLWKMKCNENMNCIRYKEEQEKEKRDGERKRLKTRAVIG